MFAPNNSANQLQTFRVQMVLIGPPSYGRPGSVLVNIQARTATDARQHAEASHSGYRFAGCRTV